MKSFFTAIGCVLFLAACAEEETSTCEVGGPCEEYLMAQCQCCGNADLVEGGSADLVEACQQDKRDACETGRLIVSQSPEQCSSSLDTIRQYEAAGMDFCVEVDAEQLEMLCRQPLNPAGATDEGA